MCLLQRAIWETDCVNHLVDHRYPSPSIFFFLLLWVILADFQCVLLVLFFSKRNSTALHCWVWYLFSIKRGFFFLPFEEVYLYVLYLCDYKDLPCPLLTLIFNFWLWFWLKWILKWGQCFSFAVFVDKEERIPQEEVIQVLAQSAILTMWFRHRDFFFWSS